MISDEDRKYLHELVDGAIDGRLPQADTEGPWSDAEGWEDTNWSQITIENIVAWSQMFRLKPEARKVKVYLYSDDGLEFTSQKDISEYPEGIKLLGSAEIVVEEKDV